MTDPESGLICSRNRISNARLGAWLTRDPLGYADARSLYQYLGNRPMSLLDPLGLARVQHHWLPDAFKPIFDGICRFNIDDYVSFIDDKVHHVIHDIFNFNAQWAFIIQASLKNGKIDCCFLATEAARMMQNTILWLKAYGWAPDSLNAIQTYKYVRAGTRGPAVRTTPQWQKLTSPGPGKDCLRSGTNTCNPQKEVDAYLADNKWRNPAAIEVGPYGNLPGSTPLQGPLIDIFWMLLPGVLFSPSEGFIEDSAASQGSPSPDQNIAPTDSVGPMKLSPAAAPLKPAA
jgi:RHS repeat-associated protein